MKLTQEQYDALQAKSKTQEKRHFVMSGRPIPTTAQARQATTKARAAKVWPNKVTYVDGIRFTSKLESRYYMQLKLRRAAGECLYFLCQVPLVLEGGVRYVVDFMIAYAGRAPQFVDTTGRLTQVKINKLKQVAARYGIEVEIVRNI